MLTDTKLLHSTLTHVPLSCTHILNTTTLHRYTQPIHTDVRAYNMSSYLPTSIHSHAHRHVPQTYKPYHIHSQMLYPYECYTTHLASIATWECDSPGTRSGSILQGCQCSHVFPDASLHRGTQGNTLMTVCYLWTCVRRTGIFTVHFQPGPEALCYPPCSEMATLLDIQ